MQGHCPASWHQITFMIQLHSHPIPTTHLWPLIRHQGHHLPQSRLNPCTLEAQDGQLGLRPSHRLRHLALPAAEQMDTNV